MSPHSPRSTGETSRDLGLQTRNRNGPVRTERTERTVTDPVRGPVTLREKSRQCRGVAARAHRSLGDLQDLVRGKTGGGGVGGGGGQHRSRKSEGKDYKIVRREYIY